MNLVKCVDCKFYERKDGDQYGACFRLPPQVIGRNKEDRESRFPDVKEDWSCGEGRNVNWGDNVQ
jgi:hypothetical protein